MFGLVIPASISTVELATLKFQAPTTWHFIISSWPIYQPHKPIHWLKTMNGAIQGLRFEVLTAILMKMAQFYWD
jgi:hypothetical protein